MYTLKVRSAHFYFFLFAAASLMISSCSTTDLSGGSNIRKVRVKSTTSLSVRTAKKAPVHSQHADSLGRIKDQHIIVKFNLPGLNKLTLAFSPAIENVKPQQVINKKRRLDINPDYIISWPGLNQLPIIKKDNPQVNIKKASKSEEKLGFGLAALLTALIGIALLFVTPVIGFFLELVVFIFGIYGVARRKSIIDLILAILALLIAIGFLLFVFQGLVN